LEKRQKQTIINKHGKKKMNEALQTLEVDSGIVSSSLSACDE
jgi:hypothetical protein